MVNVIQTLRYALAIRSGAEDMYCRVLMDLPKKGGLQGDVPMRGTLCWGALESRYQREWSTKYLPDV